MWQQYHELFQRQKIPSSIDISNSTSKRASPCILYIIFTAVTLSKPRAITNSSVLSENEEQTSSFSSAFHANFREKFPLLEERAWSATFNRLLDFISWRRAIPRRGNTTFSPLDSKVFVLPAKMYSPARFLSENFRTGWRGERRGEKVFLIRLSFNKRSGVPSNLRYQARLVSSCAPPPFLLLVLVE